MTAHLPTIKQLQYLVALRGAWPFRQGRRRLLRHPVDAVGRPARARDAARRHLGRAHAPRRPLHRAGREDRRQGGSRAARGRGTRRDGPRRRPAAARRAADGRDPDHRPVPAAGDASAAARRMAEPQALPARGNQPGGVRGAAPRPARLRAARSCPTRCGDVDSAPLFDDRLFVAFPRGEAPARRHGRRRCDRREPDAAARGRPLPQGPCAVGLQPARACAPTRR